MTTIYRKIEAPAYGVAFDADGLANGIIRVPDATKFYPGALCWLSADGTQASGLLDFTGCAAGTSGAKIMGIEVTVAFNLNAIATAADWVTAAGLEPLLADWVTITDLGDGTVQLTAVPKNAAGNGVTLVAAGTDLGMAVGAATLTLGSDGVGSTPVRVYELIDTLRIRVQKDWTIGDYSLANVTGYTAANGARIDIGAQIVQEVVAPPVGVP